MQYNNSPSQCTNLINEYIWPILHTTICLHTATRYMSICPWIEFRFPQRLIVCCSWKLYAQIRIKSHTKISQHYCIYHFQETMICAYTQKHCFLLNQYNYLDLEFSIDFQCNLTLHGISLRMLCT